MEELVITESTAVYFGRTRTARAFWFESSPPLLDGPFHFVFLTWLGLQSKINRPILREDVIGTQPWEELLSRVWCPLKGHVDFFPPEIRDNIVVS